MLSSFLPPVAYQMFLILATLVTLCFSLYKVQTPASPQPKITACFPFNYLPVTLPDPTNKNLRAIYIYEKFCFQYSVVWMFAFFLIVAFQIYESLTSPYGVNSYLFVCGVLSLPYIICPLFLPRSPAELTTPLHSLYSTHCTLFLLIYSFIGNYWYTHYFYSVLNAQYTFVGIRLNDVPVGMYFATVFYFASYHAFSNTVIRYIDVMYKQSFLKTVLGVTVVVSLSYFTAFMETLSISAFPYYTFADRDYAYTVGSLFYGIYFIVSFPMFYYFQDNVRDGVIGLYDTTVAACGAGMLILCALDFTRLALGIDFVMKVYA